MVSVAILNPAVVAGTGLVGTDAALLGAQFLGLLGCLRAGLKISASISGSPVRAVGPHLPSL